MPPPSSSSAPYPRCESPLPIRLRQPGLSAPHRAQAARSRLYPGDALVGSLQNYPSAAYPIIAGLSATLGVAVEPLYLAIWIALRLWIVAALMLIAARFVPDYWGRVFVALVAATTGWAVVHTHRQRTHRGGALRTPSLPSPSNSPLWPHGSIGERRRPASCWRARSILTP